MNRVLLVLLALTACFPFATPAAAAAPPALAPQVIVPLSERLPAWQIVGAVVLGAFVAGLIGFVVAHLRGRRPRGAA